MTYSPISIARRLAPEDIAPGRFIVVLHAVHEVYPCDLWERAQLGPVRPVRVRCLECAGGEPLRVITVCLPFVRAEDADGDVYSLDVRRMQLAEVSEEYALEEFTRPKLTTR